MPLKSKLDLTNLSNYILKYIPEHVFESDSTTFFDPWINGGSLVSAIESKLRVYGHSEQNISDRVSGLHNRELLLNAAINRYNLIGNYSVGDIENHCKIKYDAIITMPPFNNNESLAKRLKSNENVMTMSDGGNAYYLKYVKEFYKYSNSYFAMAVPLNRWFQGTKMKFRKDHFDDMGLYRAELLDSSYYREMNTKNLAMFHFKIGRNGTSDVYIKGNFTGVYMPKDVNFDSVDKTKIKNIFGHSSKLLDTRKMLTGTTRLSRSDAAPYLSKTKTKTHTNKFYETATNISWISDSSLACDEYMDCWRVGFSEITHPNTIGKLVTLQPGDTCSSRLYYIVCHDELDAENVRKQLTDMEPYWEFIKNSNTNSKQYIEYVPDINVNIKSLIETNWNLADDLTKSDYKEEQMSFDF